MDYICEVVESKISNMTLKSSRLKNKQILLAFTDMGKTETENVGVDAHEKSKQRCQVSRMNYKPGNCKDRVR